MPGRAARPRRRSRRTGSSRTPAHPGQPRVRPGCCAGAHRPSTAGGSQDSPRVRGSRPPSAQQRPLVPSRPARGVRPMAALAGRVPLRPSPTKTPRPVPGAPAGVRRGPDGARRLWSSFLASTAPLQRSPELRETHLPRSPCPCTLLPGSHRQPLTHAFSHHPQGCAAAYGGALRHLLSSEDLSGYRR